MKYYPSQWINNGPTCRDVTNRASEYLDDHLPILTGDQVSLHLESCAHCLVYVKQIDLVSSALRGLPTLFPSRFDRLRLRHPFAARHGQPA